MALVPIQNDQTVSRTDDTVFKVPLPLPKRKKKVLEEEHYAKELERIIQRDFFPDVAKLKAQNDYLEAESRNDLVKIRELQMQYRPTPKRPNTNSSDFSSTTPLTFQSPATFETPASPLTRVDKDVPRDPSVTSSEQQSRQESEQQMKHAEFGLDEFLQRVTSEDNASFEEIMEESNKKHMRKYPWLYEEPAKKNPTLAIQSGSATSNQLAIENERQNHVETWDYKAKNAVMQIPEGIPFTAAEVMEREKQQIELHHRNTRFQEDPWKNIDLSKDLSAVSGLDKVGVDGLEVNASNTPQVHGYRFMATPSPAPGVSESPLMTWGEIEGTPFALDASDTPLIAYGSGPQFKISDTPQRDKLHLELVDNVTKKHRAKREEALKQVRSLAKTPKLGSALSSERLASMSPAAQRLATRHLGIRFGADKALTASYTPSRRTPAASPRGSRTPSLSTPSITDNLLDIRRKPDSSQS